MQPDRCPAHSRGGEVAKNVKPWLPTKAGPGGVSQALAAPRCTCNAATLQPCGLWESQPLSIRCACRQGGAAHSALWDCSNWELSSAARCSRAYLQCPTLSAVVNSHSARAAAASSATPRLLWCRLPAAPGATLAHHRGPAQRRGTKGHKVSNSKQRSTVVAAS